MLNLQNMLFQMMMSKAGAATRAKETEAARLHQAQLMGYRTKTPEAVTVQGPGGGRAIPGPLPTPDITIGGKGLYAPQITVETKKLPNGQTAYFLKQGQKTTGFSVTKPEKRGKLFTVQTPKGPKYYEHTGQGQFRETDLPAPPKSTSRLTVGKDGEIVWEQGVLGEPTKGTQTFLQKEEFKADIGLARIEDTIAAFKPEFQELGTRWGNLWTGVKEKLGVKLSPEDKKQLADFSTYRKGAIKTLNEEIHRLTGAQMSRHEARRLVKGLPNPGTGLFDGDSPTEFISALKVTYKDLKRVQARARYYQARNINVKNLAKQEKLMSLEQFDQVINKRAATIESELRAIEPNLERLNPAEFYKRVKDKVKEEFGL
jgi:hypothetical protein